MLQPLQSLLRDELPLRRVGALSLPRLRGAQLPLPPVAELQLRQQDALLLLLNVSALVRPLFGALPQHADVPLLLVASAQLRLVFDAPLLPLAPSLLL